MLYFHNNIDEAKAAYEQFENVDPFPDIQPALLTSSDIQDYVSATGMICPCHRGAENFKPASYSVNFSGEYLYWDVVESRRKKIKNTLKKGESFTLKRNSIAYLKLEPYFQFPNYIAARFNLQIKHVYRGLLVGTGPLVDPGYTGFLYLPIHNLTDEDYEIAYGEPLIWMEFTKLSLNSYWSLSDTSPKREGIFYPFKSDSRDKDLEYFLHRAHPNESIISTMQGVIAEINKVKTETEDLNVKTREVNDSASKATTSFNKAILVSLVAIIFTALFTVYQNITIANRTTESLNGYDQRFQFEQTNSQNQKAGLEELKKEVSDLTEKVLKQNAEIEKLKK
jgi:deoxycytidine triphosphate deaminase